MDFKMKPKSQITVYSLFFFILFFLVDFVKNFTSGMEKVFPETKRFGQLSRSFLMLWSTQKLVNVGWVQITIAKNQRRMSSVREQTNQRFIPKI